MPDLSKRELATQVVLNIGAGLAGSYGVAAGAVAQGAVPLALAGIDWSVLCGLLPEGSPVREFVDLVDAASARSSRVTMARACALWLAKRDLGIATPTSADVARRTYSELKPDQRRLMHLFDKRMQDATVSLMTWGSPLGMILAPVVWLARRLQPDSRVARSEDKLPAVAREVISQRSLRLLSQVIPADAQFPGLR